MGNCLKLERMGNIRHSYACSKPEANIKSWTPAGSISSLNVLCCPSKICAATHVETHRSDSAELDVVEPIFMDQVWLTWIKKWKTKWWWWRLICEFIVSRICHKTIVWSTHWPLTAYYSKWSFSKQRSISPYVLISIGTIEQKPFLSHYRVRELGPTQLQLAYVTTQTTLQCKQQCRHMN